MFCLNLARCLLLAVCLSLMPGLCLAQIQAPSVPQPGQLHIPPNTRSIEGVVLNAQGQPAPNAVVLLKDTKTLQVRSYIALQDGKYHFYGLSTDVNYQVRAEAQGWTSPIKLVSVFESKKVIKVKLKLKKKRKPYSA